MNINKTFQIRVSKFLNLQSIQRFQLKQWKCLKIFIWDYST